MVTGPRGPRDATSADAARETVGAIKTRKQMEQSATAAWARANPEEALAQSGHDHLGRDKIMTRMLEERGVLGVKPPTFSRTQIDDQIADGATEFFHGFGSAEGKTYHQRILNGQFEPGQGTSGSGLYTGIGLSGKAEALSYSGIGKHGQQTPGSGLLRGAVPKGARVITSAQINKQFHTDRNAFLRAHGSKVSSMNAGIGRAPKDLSKEDQAVFAAVFGDFGRWAAAKGYDYVGGPKDGWGLVINPTAISWQRSFIPDPKQISSANYKVNEAWLTGKGMSDLYQSKLKAAGGDASKVKPMTKAEDAAIRKAAAAQVARLEQARIDKFAQNRANRAARAAARASAKQAKAADAAGQPVGQPTTPAITL